MEEDLLFEEEEEYSLSNEDLGLCHFCGAADYEGCEGDCPSWDE